MNLNTIIQNSHHNATEKGFHDANARFDAFLESAKTAAALSCAYGGFAKKQLVDFFAQAEAVAADYRLAKQSQALLLMVTEIAEAAEALRTGDAGNHAEEMADVIIRATDYAGEYGIDLNAEVLEKMRVNRERPVMHGGKRF